MERFEADQREQHQPVAGRLDAVHGRVARPRGLAARDRRHDVCRHAISDNVYAVSLKDQTFRWKYEPKQDADVVPVMCCDTVSRGLAYGDGKIFLQQADTTLVALDARTGKVIWSVKNGNPKIGETNTNAPHVFKDKVVTGISGGEFGVRGRLIAYDLKTGKMA